MMEYFSILISFKTFSDIRRRGIKTKCKKITFLNLNSCFPEPYNYNILKYFKGIIQVNYSMFCNYYLDLGRYRI